MYEDLIIREELFGLSNKKFDLILLLCKRMQHLDLGHPKAIDTTQTDILSVLIEEVKKDALLCEVTPPELTPDIVENPVPELTKAE